MRTAVYILGGLATLLALVAAVLLVGLGHTALYSSSEKWRLVLVVIPALLHVAWPVVGIVLAKRSRAGWGLAMELLSLPISLILVVTLPMMIGAAGQP